MLAPYENEPIADKDRKEVCPKLKRYCWFLLPQD